MNRSIRKQLLLSLVTILSAVSVIRLGYGYAQAQDFANDAYDDMLRNSADSIGARLEVVGNTLKLDLPVETLAVFTHDGKDTFCYEVFESSGKRLIGDSKLIDSALDLQDAITSGGRDVVREGKHMRRFAAKVSVPEARLRSLTVVVAETLTARTKLLMHAFIPIAISQSIVMIVSLAAVWICINKAFVPFSRLRESILKRNRRDLVQLPTDDAPEELQSFLAEFNQMCASLQENLEARERFVSNAAHQLRTPIAALKTYSSFGCGVEDLKELRGIVEKMDGSADALTRLVNQLLVLVRVEETSSSVASKFEKTDLNSTVSTVVSMLDSSASLKQIDLNYEPVAEPAFVIGDPIGLEQLVTSIIENAIQYSPEGTAVQIAVTQGDLVSLLVEDQGPGIPTNERRNVLERFYRIRGASGSGSGLGLSIVNQVARAHHADVLIDDPDSGVGTKIVVTFPKAV